MQALANKCLFFSPPTPVSSGIGLVCHLRTIPKFYFKDTWYWVSSYRLLHKRVVTSVFKSKHGCNQNTPLSDMVCRKYIVKAVNTQTRVYKTSERRGHKLDLESCFLHDLFTVPSPDSTRVLSEGELRTCRRLWKN